MRERAVHLEAWAVQALAERIDPELNIATGPRAEEELRAVLEAHPDGEVRERGFVALDRLEAARDALAAAAPASLLEALAALDTIFVELTGREPVRNHGRAYGARTLACVDCLRDLDVTVGPDLVQDMAPALQVMFEAGRWYCGQVNEIGRQVIERALAAHGSGPFLPVMIEVLRTLMSLPPELAGACAELQRRMAALLADPDVATVASRAAAMFSDHAAAWPMAVCHSGDVQIAAADEAAVAAGDYLAVIGDVHPGSNPLMQGVFAHRHPDPAGFLRAMCAAMGRDVTILLPPRGAGIGLDARGIAVTPRDWIHIAAVPDGRVGRPSHVAGARAARRRRRPHRPGRDAARRADRRLRPADLRDLRADI